MKIESLEIKNFRQFYQYVSIEFSTDPKKNVTVVHGANGSGKTSLLNAFKWCFYGQTDFDTSNEYILNESAILEKNIGDSIELEVCVNFVHEGKRYFARRTQKFKKTDSALAESLSRPEFILEFTSEDGQTKRASSPDATLQQILPRDLHPYFFFNGERIEHIAGINQSSQIRDAIRKLMGLELVDRAITHVGKVEATYNKEVRKGVSSEHSSLLESIELRKAEQAMLEEKIEAQKRIEESCDTEAKNAERELRKFEDSIELQEKRTLLECQIKELSDQADYLRGRQRELLDRNSHLVLSSGLFDSSSELIEDNRKKGILPFGINTQFIDDRISMGRCICGTEIIADSVQYNNLMEVKNTAGTEHQEAAYSTVSGLLRSLSEYSSKFVEEYTTVTTDLKKASSQIQNLKNESSNIGAQLVKSDDKTITKYEEQRRGAVEKSQTARDERKLAERDLSDLAKHLIELNGKKKNIELLEGKINSAQRRMDKCETLGMYLKDLRAALVDQVRIELSSRVDDTFQSIIRKPVQAVIDENYCLQVRKTLDTGEELQVNEQSTGERQVTSLSFISSIISLAREKHKTKKEFFQGGLYPLVMDSPFGALDDDYREKVSANVSILAEQVIMFVSNSQWSGKVSEACEQNVGRSYQLIYHSPKVTAETADTYSVPSENEYEYSTIRAVKR